jgi:hypothetical protein
MALAYLTFESNDGSRSRFKIDIGKNRFYSYAVGDKETRRSNGLNMLLNRKFTSPLMGPLPESAMGRAALEIPNHLLDKNYRYVQLMSFRTQSQEGPAISNIVKARESLNDIPMLPEITFSRSKTMRNPNFMYMTENISFPYKESKFSSAMFLNVLTSLIPKVLPILPGIIGGLMGGGKKSSTSSGSNSGSGIMALIANLLKQVMALNGSGAAVTSKSLVRSQSREYSQAAAAPALLAALPALMPLLKQVLTPDTIKAILQNISPTKMIGTVTSGLKDLANLGIKSHEQDLEHLRKLNPGVDDPALDKLLEGLSINLSRDKGPTYRRVESVKLKFVNIIPTMLYGRSRVSYLAGRDLSFPMQVDTPRTTGKAILILTVKDPETLAVKVKKKFPLDNVTAGPLPIKPRLFAAQLNKLKPNQDYLVCATLLWKNKSGKKIGTSITQMITLVPKYSFDRVEGSGRLIPLNNINRHRAFWHKSWQGTLTPESRRFIFDCKYYFALEGDRNSNARMETLTRLEKSGLHTETGRLKTGMVLSPYILNHLIPKVSNYPMLNDAQLKALRSLDFADRFHQAARVRVKLKGRPGSSAALWNYPVVKMQRIVLKKVQQSNDNGHVITFKEQPVYFPMPVKVHFIGVRSQ